MLLPDRRGAKIRLYDLLCICKYINTKLLSSNRATRTVKYNRHLHPQQPVHRGEKGGEVLTLLEASLQIHLLITPFRLVEALFWVLFLVCGGVSVHDKHVVNTVDPLLPEVLDEKVSLLLRELWWLCCCLTAVSVCSGWRGLRPLHRAT